jgi:Rod binding domain-containing protein
VSPLAPTTPGVAGLLPTGESDARLDQLRRLPEGAARRAAATELQSIFLVQLLRAMRKTIPESDFLPRSPARSIYEGAFDERVAETLAAGDPIGLVRTLAGPQAGGSSSAAERPITAVERKDGPKP